ncbi:class I SAM-dependent methyltransferase [Pediococcus claussenii]|uniref:rRNA methylase n=1 Tax=Pediococcus claussenii (strain ATCC BAA-344 / DSM 14800 / JCM 18046 / KCTC 3811 / LMG 21948 / P06) TaxID=701521 RepID=G8PDW3_PEDCP|nr:class I SAM-dependent methyltransferase [Pediococcus claussenii]AEV95448.1 putative rRNA methylase [Pediococcus claussenii ATCC BAA-344]ANZ68974.1 SAM-dependent methyltransferase [Pediococcus claussenii]ANZ70790.1 SAM-dependent methyltransferase [Pediococcus claussenii]KRN19090.1 hypothetical protein IV79_GL001752 [Pediococcus claussenii]
MLKNSMQYSHIVLQEIINKGDNVIDATMGNGHDTQFLAKSVGATGHVYAFDIQQDAINHTKDRLTQLDLISQTTLINDSHSKIDNYVSNPISAAIFNLGYLPGNNKSIITHFSTTIPAINSCLRLLKVGGRIAVVCYYGHPGGKDELDHITHYLSQIEQQEFSVLRYEFLNQINQPPILLIIEKK